MVKIIILLIGMAMAMWGQISSKLVQFTQQVVPFNSSHHTSIITVSVFIIIHCHYNRHHRRHHSHRRHHHLVQGPSLMVLPFSRKEVRLQRRCQEQQLYWSSTQSEKQKSVLPQCSNCEAIQKQMSERNTFMISVGSKVVAR